MYVCPKCDKGLTVDEMTKGKCLNCKLQFTINDMTDADLFSDKLFIKNLKKEIKMERNKKNIDYHETAISMIKAGMPGVIINRRKESTPVYMVQDKEMVAFLFRLKVIKREVRIEFDVTLKNYPSVKLYKKLNPKLYNRGLKSILITRDFGYMMELCLSVYNSKKKFLSQHKKKFLKEIIGRSHFK